MVLGIPAVKKIGASTNFVCVFLRLESVIHRQKKLKTCAIQNESDCTELVQTGITPIILRIFEWRGSLFHKVFNRTVENFHTAVTFEGCIEKLD
jgi:hypothetical protein